MKTNTPRLPLFSRRRVLAVLAGGVLATALSACSSLTVDRSEQGLRQRAETFWRARVAADEVTAYAYEEGSLQADGTLQAYLKAKGGVEYVSASVVSVERKDATHAVVMVDLVYNVPAAAMRNQSGKIADQWVLLDKGWYHAKPGARFFLHGQ